jgi:hypothetical protein
VYASGRQLTGAEIGYVSAVIVAGFALVSLSIWIWRSVQTYSRHIRYEIFAKENDLLYIPFTTGTEHVGLIFRRGFDQLATQQFVSSASLPTFEIGNYTYSAQEGKRVRTYVYGYIRVELDRHLPHMVLDAVQNNTRLLGVDIETNLSIDFDPSQILQLEGNFNEYFTLYAPVGYERDALYIFTPDLMALLIDESSQFDAEIIDNNLYFYSKSFNFDREQTWSRLMTIIDLVGQKARRQSDLYADERAQAIQLPDDTIAWAGRRLSPTKVTWVSVAVAVIVFVAFYSIQYWVMKV